MFGLYRKKKTKEYAKLNFPIKYSLKKIHYTVRYKKDTDEFIKIINPPRC